MLEQANLPDILPACDITDEAYLTEAEGEIRGYGRLVFSGIIAIGKKLSEVRTRVGHGKYGGFIKRLGFSRSTAQNFVQSYDLLIKFANFVDLESLQIDATALYLLARPSTSDEVRIVALEKARTEGISHAEVQRFIADARAEAMNAAAEKAEAEAKEPPHPPVDTALPFKAMKARRAIFHCIGEIELSAAEYIAIEVEATSQPLRRLAIVRENLGELAAAIQLLSQWFQKFTELYEAEIGRAEVMPPITSGETATSL
jgi:hypothetical protein